jgi:hypothetical protein
MEERDVGIECHLRGETDCIELAFFKYAFKVAIMRSAMYVPFPTNGKSLIESLTAEDWTFIRTRSICGLSER